MPHAPWKWHQGCASLVQVGWVTGPPHLISAVFKAHQFLTFCLPGSLQTAVGHGLDKERTFFEYAISPLSIIYPRF